MKIQRIIFVLAMSYPVIVSAFFCPTNFNIIDYGMSPDQVTQACGKPDDQKDSMRQNDNIPQEWSYFVPQAVYMGGSQQTAQGTLKTSVTFDDKGKAVNISVNGIGVGETTICGNNTVQLGATKEQIKAACGNPAFINKQSADVNSGVEKETRVVEFFYSSVTPKMTLIFENGRLTEKK